MIMSKCSASVLTVYGSVGVVEDGITFGWEETGRRKADVRVHGAGRRDQALGRHEAGIAAHDQRWVVDDVGIAGPAHADDSTVFDADVALDDSEHRIEHEHAGDDQVELGI